MCYKRPGPRCDDYSRQRTETVYIRHEKAESAYQTAFTKYENAGTLDDPTNKAHLAELHSTLSIWEIRKAEAEEQFHMTNEGIRHLLDTADNEDDPVKAEEYRAKAAKAQSLLDQARADARSANTRDRNLRDNLTGVGATDDEVAGVLSLKADSVSGYLNNTASTKTHDAWKAATAEEQGVRAAANTARKTLTEKLHRESLETQGRLLTSAELRTHPEYKALVTEHKAKIKEAQDAAAFAADNFYRSPRGLKHLQTELRKKEKENREVRKTLAQISSGKNLDRFPGYAEISEEVRDAAFRGSTRLEKSRSAELAKARTAQERAAINDKYNKKARLYSPAAVEANIRTRLAAAHTPDQDAIRKQNLELRDLQRKVNAYSAANKAGNTNKRNRLAREQGIRDLCAAKGITKKRTQEIITQYRSDRKNPDGAKTGRPSVPAHLRRGKHTLTAHATEEHHKMIEATAAARGMTKEEHIADRLGGNVEEHFSSAPLHEVQEVAKNNLNIKPGPGRNPTESHGLREAPIYYPTNPATLARFDQIGQFYRVSRSDAALALLTGKDIRAVESHYSRTNRYLKERRMADVAPNAHQAMQGNPGTR